MEAAPQPPTASPEFTPRQLELIAALPNVGNRDPLAAMLAGALVAMRQNEQDNPEHSHPMSRLKERELLHRRIIDDI